MIITQEYLKSILKYNKETGIFTWLKRNGNIAGTLNKISGYIIISINNKNYRAHRLAWLYMTGNFPVNQMDHINRIRNDNRFENLREATNQENDFNKGEYKNNTSGYKGVFLNKEKNKWQAQIGINGKNINLGYFTNPEDASAAYETAKAKYHIIQLSIAY